MEIDGEKVQLGIPEQMRGMAHDAHPARPRRARREEAAGGVFFLLLAVVELRPRPGAQRDRRPVHGDDD